jgi:hypothetical protein
MKKKKAISRDSKRFKILEPAHLFSFSKAGQKSLTKEEICEKINQITNDLIKKRCATKTFEQSAGTCATGVGSTPNLVDLVILIDTSGSMEDEAANLSSNATAAIQAASQSCPSDVRVKWFGIEGTWAGTNFTQSYRAYLNGIGILDAQISGTPLDSEDGAAAIFDLSRHFDWRSGARRIIFYLGDEAMENGDPQDALDVSATDAAIAEALAQSVTVFTYLGTGAPDAGTINDYTRIASTTSGQAFAAPVANVGGFQAVLEKIICIGGKKEGCKTVKLPIITPCLRLRWGDDKTDQIETDDWEVLCITACNPYENVVMKDLTIHLIIQDASGNPPPNLPDGTPSVFITPDLQICFGDLQPCSESAIKNGSNCVSREVMLMTRGARNEVYNIIVVYCFEACFHYIAAVPAFNFELVKS